MEMVSLCGEKPEERDVKKIYKWRLLASIPVGRRMDNVMKDIQAMKIVN
jgi:hypothetical protein